MGQLQQFLGIEQYISEKNFDMDDKLPCFKENVETKCLRGTKGRSVGKEFETDLGLVLKSGDDLHILATTLSPMQTFKNQK